MNYDHLIQDLDPELRDCFYINKIAGPSIDHELVNIRAIHLAAPSLDGRNSIRLLDVANKELKYKRQLRNDYFDNKNWEQYVFIHEKMYRTEALLNCIKFSNYVMTDLWELVGRVWSMSENISQNIDDWENIWSEPCPRRWKSMDRAERNALRRLPDNIEIWRGVSSLDAIRGMSWSLDRSKAEWFARRWRGSDGPILVRGQILKKDVCAYFNGRKEREIVVLSDTVKIQEIKLL